MLTFLAYLADFPRPHKRDELKMARDLGQISRCRGVGIQVPAACTGYTAKKLPPAGHC